MAADFPVNPKKKKNGFFLFDNMKLTTQLQHRDIHNHTDYLIDHVTITIEIIKK